MSRAKPRTRLLVAAFVALCVVQIAVPARILWVREQTLRQGQSFRFLCRPVDPVDALRGRYVALGFEAAAAPAPVEEIPAGRKVAVPVAVGADGFARLGPPSATPPTHGPWIRVRFEGVRVYDDREVARVDLPFDRFYMEETVAPEVEAALRAGGDEPVPAWLSVRVLDGLAVPEELYLDGIPAREFLERKTRSLRSPAR